MNYLHSSPFMPKYLHHGNNESEPINFTFVRIVGGMCLYG